MVLDWIYLIVCVVLDAIAAVMVVKVIFPQEGEFTEALVFLITPEMWSALSGRLWDDMWAEIKLGVLVALFGGLFYSEMYIGAHHLGLDLTFGNPAIAGFLGVPKVMPSGVSG